jgi:hypothetical protein
LEREPSILLVLLPIYTYFMEASIYWRVSVVKYVIFYRENIVYSCYEYPWPLTGITPPVISALFGTNGSDGSLVFMSVLVGRREE